MERLKIDDMLYKDQEVPPARKREQEIVRELIHRMEKNGYTLINVEDGEESNPAYSASEALELIFNLDDCRVYFREPYTEKMRWVYLVSGNGEDIISDWSIRPTDVFDAVLENLTGELN